MKEADELEAEPPSQPRLEGKYFVWDESQPDYRAMLATLRSTLRILRCTCTFHDIKRVFCSVCKANDALDQLEAMICPPK